ncbi:MAG: nucleotidyltransferase [Clostridia bacterium]|nr:nucleotidyltransferase [Clostridia bacterium]
MKITGIIAEYNPFHNGHKYQIENSGADATVVVMSGNFVQRGEPAIWNKWTRAKFAVLNGVDLVLELPCDFAISSAERFAFGGVYILNSLGLIDTITFGAENDLDDLNNTLNELSEADIISVMKEHQGLSYHEARNKIVSNKDILNKPNNILGIEYLKALKKLNSDILPNVILRKGAEHNSLSPVENFASATYLRDAIKNNKDFAKFMPTPIPDCTPVTAEDFFYLIKYRLLSDELFKIGEMREGIENRIKKAILSANSFDELISSIKTKRYTYTSICRMIIQSLLNIKKDDLAEVPQYTKVLAASKKGREILNNARKKSSIPIITKGSDAKDIPEFNLDVKAGNIYSIIEKSTLNQDYTMMPYIE